MEVKLPGARADQEDGMIQLIRKVKVAHPEVRLVLNRGFEILPTPKTPDRFAHTCS